MKNKSLLIISLIFMAFLVGYTKANVKAVDTSDTFVKEAKSAILIEINTGDILFQKNENEKRSPASMTKIMAIYLVLEALDKGQIKWDEIVTVSEHAASYGGSQVYLEPGEQMSVEDLFKCMVISSANDATVALAEQVAGSEELFVQRMNERVKELGLKNTKFADPTGLSDFDEGHFSTAYDMAQMARDLLLKYEEVTVKYTSMYEDYIREDTNERFWLVNTNKLVKHVPGIDGLKTGWTSQSGYNLTATMKKDNMRLISVIMGEASPTQRNYDTVKLLKYGFSQYEAVEYRSKNYKVDEYKNILLTPQKIKIVTNDPIYFVTKKGEKPTGLEEQFKFTIDKNGVKAGEQIGELEILKDGKVIYTVPLTVEQEVKKASYFDVLGRTFKSMFFD
ncbi:D-alanyl-D-alanine carboxypeptidase [Mycoplasmatota bacterium]|nr:D-alanyl-D-alanine carboxypeptidase [Mycoplasmatota bacterium]